MIILADIMFKDSNIATKETHISFLVFALITVIHAYIAKLVDRDA